MERISNSWPAIITPKRIQELTSFCLSLEHNETKRMSFEVEHAGVRTSFGIEAFMDDLTFPDVEFFSFPELIQAIDQEHDRVCDELGY